MNYKNQTFILHCSGVNNCVEINLNCIFFFNKLKPDERSRRQKKHKKKPTIDI